MTTIKLNHQQKVLFEQILINSLAEHERLFKKGENMIADMQFETIQKFLNQIENDNYSFKPMELNFVLNGFLDLLEPYPENSPHNGTKLFKSVIKTIKEQL